MGFRTHAKGSNRLAHENALLFKIAGSWHLLFLYAHAQWEFCTKFFILRWRDEN